jgi:hypothetical protein
MSATEKADIHMTQGISQVKTTNEENAYRFLRCEKYCSFFELIPQGQRIIQGFNVEISKVLPDALRRKRSEICPNDWILHHDNVSVHKALLRSLQPKYRLLTWNALPIPLICSECLLFSKIKAAFRRKKLQDTKE